MESILSSTISDFVDTEMVEFIGTINVSKKAQIHVEFWPFFRLLDLTENSFLMTQAPAHTHTHIHTHTHTCDPHVLYPLISIKTAHILHIPVSK